MKNKDKKESEPTVEKSAVLKQVEQVADVAVATPKKAKRRHYPKKKAQDTIKIEIEAPSNVDAITLDMDKPNQKKASKFNLFKWIKGLLK